MKHLLRPNLTMSGIIAALLLSGALARAVEIKDTDMEYSRWHNSAKEAPPATACNYVYVANQKLIYYGFSGNCKTRLGQHDTNMGHSKTLIEKVSQLSERDTANLFRQQPPNPHVKAFTKDLSDWTTEVDSQRRPQKEHGTADTCLAITKESYPNQTVWFVEIKTRGDADQVETCVLNKQLGYCNRAGGGDTRGSWKDFIETVNTCIKTYTH